MWKFASGKVKILNNIDIVLVCPQVAENIGLVARTLRNTCFSHLSLVNPNLTPKSYEAAKRARDLLEKADKFNTLKEALAQSHFAFATTRRIRAHKFIYNFDEILPLIISQAQKKKISIVFGKENFGLSQKETDLCDSVFYLPANPGFPSYNLSLAVGIVCYEIAQELHTLSQLPSLELATKEDIETFFFYLEKKLKSHSYKKKAETALYSLRRLATRTHLTRNEVSLLKSLIIDKGNKYGTSQP